MKIIFLILMFCLTISAMGQKGITFEVEELSKPQGLLSNTSLDYSYKKMILSEIDLSIYSIEKNKIEFPYDIIAKSKSPEYLINFGSHSFFNGMYQAYADHRPFVLSPDIIWLLISQGFARHVNANPEELREYFVNFQGKSSLIVQVEGITLDNPDSPWENVFPEFTKQIAEHTGKDLIDVLSSDFSTTTPIEKVASEITIMEAMEPYFEYITFSIVCGIPEITLLGTTEDWQKVLDKTKKLGQYDLEWWTSELEPILEEFVDASKGDISKRFWRNMFKYHTQKGYGKPEIIDGWIVRFFPYDKDGERNDLDELEGRGNLSSEIVKVDLKFVEYDNDTLKTTPLELWAGFIGLEQNLETFALTPKIGWMIRKKDNQNFGQKEIFESESNGIAIRVKEIPPAILMLKEIEFLEVEFLDDIIIPDNLANVKIGKLILSGDISRKDIKRIKELFPNSEVIINDDIIE